MAIILEGPDAAGKTTLAKTLVQHFSNHSLFLTGAAPKTLTEMVRMCGDHSDMAGENIIIDRVTPISHPIYNKQVENHPVIIECRQAIIDNPYCVIIYCRPSNEILMDKNSHEWKEYDSEEHIEFVLKNAHDLINRYDVMMETVPHIKYDWQYDMVDDLIVQIEAKLGK